MVLTRHSESISKQQKLTANLELLNLFIEKFFFYLLSTRVDDGNKRRPFECYKEKLLEFLVFVTNKEDGLLPRKQNTSQCKRMYRGPIL